MSKLGFLICSIISLMSVQFVFAHGTVTSPPSRIYNCYQESPESPDSAPCIAAVASHGTQPLYDWNEINQGDANGQHIDLIQDGNLASGGRPIKYGGMDLVSPDWVATPVAAGPFTVSWTNTAPHATSYYLVYITNADWTPAQPLTWSSLTLLKQTDPSIAESSVDIPVILPARSGKHVIYSIWQRSDSGEAFYSTSDVDFGVVLPVDLTAFDVELSDKNEVELSWSTASERNNAYFEIEHSVDGTNFNTIGRVAGNGLTDEAQYYNFTDRAVLVSGMNYYRLRQVDFDGAFEYSEIREIDIKSNNSVSIYPTFAQDFIQISIAEGIGENLEFQIFDVTGRYVKAAIIEAERRVVNFSIADFEKGAYFIRFRLNGVVVTEQFVKM